MKASQTQPDGPREGGSIAAEPQQNPTLPSEGEREKIELILRDSLWVEAGLDDGELIYFVSGIEEAADAILSREQESPPLSSGEDHG